MGALPIRAGAVPRARRHRWAAAVAAVAALVLGACGSSDDGTADTAAVAGPDLTAIVTTTTVAHAPGAFEESMCPTVGDVDAVVSDMEIQALEVDLREDSLFCLYDGEVDYLGATVAFTRRDSAQAVTDSIEELPWDDEPPRAAVTVSLADEAYQGEYSSFRQLMARIGDLEILIRLDQGGPTGHELTDLVPLYELAATKLT